MNLADFERLLFRHGALTEPSVAAIRPRLSRWASTYAEVAREFGTTAASNFLTLCILQAMPVRDRAKEHDLRNLMPWLRPYHI
ncbi:MAG TPA: hypothetical protein VEJ87_06325 [Acidimicrobiales bacterium]|nr:hypothetical protein [Acidimicrobiales bacterium]